MYNQGAYAQQGRGRGGSAPQQGRGRGTPAPLNTAGVAAPPIPSPVGMGGPLTSPGRGGVSAQAGRGQPGVKPSTPRGGAVAKGPAIPAKEKVVQPMDFEFLSVIGEILRLVEDGFDQNSSAIESCPPAPPLHPTTASTPFSPSHWTSIIQHTLESPIP
mmetsp:Transcript_8285/g.13113  ORF Transcript_8285/g.13113 Transcript_8285/m.13113 type:complete len:159 (-) Transcript_8285:533-1009(-)